MTLLGRHLINKLHCMTVVYIFSASIFCDTSFADNLTLEREAVLATSGLSIDTHVVFKLEDTGPGIVFQHYFANTSAEYARFKFVVDIENSASEGWTIAILSRNSGESYQPAWRIDASELCENVIWSDEIRGSEILIRLMVDNSTIEPHITLTQVAQAQEPAVPFSIVGEDERQPIGVFPDEIKALGKAVAKIRFVGDNGPIYNCTGFLLSQDLMLTNSHCINSKSERQSAIVAFDYDEKLSHETFNRLSELIQHDYDLDYSLVRLTRSMDREPLKISDARITKDDKLIIIQHPGGEPKQVSVKGCAVDKPSIKGRGSAKTDFSHKCDTLGGSSGAPVILKDSLLVIGLHHLGFKEGSSNLLNRAVHITRIMEHLKNSNVELTL